MVVNVDNPDDAAAWGAVANATGGFVTVILSPNVHELRGYTRGAAVASGDVLVLLQDDDVPTGSCEWLSNLTALFAAKPRMGAVALKKACIVNNMAQSCGWAWGEEVVRYEDPRLNGLRYQYATVADFSPLAVRATAYADVGGCDEGAAPPGESGIMLDFELTARMWAAGWHVSQMAVRCLKGGAEALGVLPGTLHGVSAQIRQKNQGLNGQPFQARFSNQDLFEIYLEVKRKNAALLPRPGHAEKLAAMYSEAESRIFAEFAPRAAELTARLARIAALRNDTDT